MKMRIQVAIYHELVAEVVGTSEEVDHFWNKWVNSRLEAGYDAGGAVIGRADKPRVWNVAIGEDVRTAPENTEQFADRR